MNRYLTLIVAAVLGLLLTQSPSDDAASSASSVGAARIVGASEREPTRGSRYFWEQRTYGSKPIPKNAYGEAKRQWDALPSSAPPLRKKPKAAPATATKSSSKLRPMISGPITALSGVVWQPIGPNPINSNISIWNGRVDSIAINPNDPNVIFMGASAGGVWRTNDAGAHWTPLTDHEPTLAIGEPSAIAIDPNNTNIVYVGSSGFRTGPASSEGGQENTSLGILKSTDGGGSWVILGSGFPAGNNGNATQFAGADIYGIAVDPANSNIVYLAGSLGLWTSVDGGLNWSRGTNGGPFAAQSLAFDSSSPGASRVLFAGVNGLGVLKSSDGGASWSKPPVLSSTTPAVSAALAAHSLPSNAAQIGRIVVALAPPTSSPNPAGVQVVYVAIEGFNGDLVGSALLGIFQSTDQGATWSQRSATGIGGCQCFFTNTIAVDPASPGDGVNDIVLWGGTSLFRSTDSANSFTDIGRVNTTGIHGDLHGLAFVPQPPMTPSIIYAGSDGGIFRSTDSGMTWTGASGGPPTINAGGLQTGLFYHMDLKRDTTASVNLGALQDVGQVQGIAGNTTWTDRLLGDGLVSLFDNVNLSTAYGIDTGGPQISTDNGVTWSDITNNIPHSAAADNQVQGFQNTLEVDPSNGGFLYFGGGVNTDTSMVTHPGELWQSRNSGGTWSQITSFTNTTNTGNVGPTAIAPANGNNVATVDGVNAVYVSTNALANPATVTFTNITRNLPNRAVARLAFDPNDPTVLYAVMSGFNSGTPGSPGHVFVTNIAGGNWTDISPPVDVPFDAIVLDGTSSPSTIYAGSDLGVLRSVDGGKSWATLDAFHFPNAPVTDLRINSTAGVLRASTYGRGVFDFVAANGPVVAVSPQNNLHFGDTCLGSTATLTLEISNVGTQNLVINSVQRLLGSNDFSVQPNPSTPVTISPDAHVDFMVQFAPTATAAESATIRISSNDPNAPVLDLTTNGNGIAPKLGTVIAGSGNFGDVCLGSFKDLNLTITDGSACTLSVTGIKPSDPDFTTASIIAFPLSVAGNGSVAVPIRFQPAAYGAKSGSIAITSNGGSGSVNVSGNAPPGLIAVSGSASFGNVCAGTNAQQTITVANTGPCDLHVTGASIACADFTIEGNPFPATISADASIPLVIGFTPTSGGTKTCTLTITSDSGGATTNTPVTLSGTTPEVKIDVPAQQNFPATVIQSVGACTSSAPFPVSNNGSCPINITGLAVSGKYAADYSLAGLPSLPTPLQPGHILGEGNLKTVFGPTKIVRNETATVNLTYESDPITHATAPASENVCGEGTSRGLRTLVTAGGVPLPTGMVTKLQLSRLTSNRKGISVDNVMNPPLQSVSQTAPCASFQFHFEWGGVTNPIQLTAGDYQLTATAIVNGKKVSKTVSFSLTTCSFNQNVVVAF